MPGEHNTALRNPNKAKSVRHEQTDGGTSQLSQHGVKAFLFVTGERRGNCGKMRRKFQKLGGGVRRTPFSRNTPHLPENACGIAPGRRGSHHRAFFFFFFFFFFTNLKVTKGIMGSLPRNKKTELPYSVTKAAMFRAPCLP
jgi:hypothetical protein